MWYGGARIAFCETPLGTMQIASFSKSDNGVIEAPKVQDDAFRQKARRMQETYFNETRRQADAGAELILWPEAAAICVDEDKAALLERGKKVAHEKGIFLAMPLYTKSLSGNEPRENQLVVVSPEGKVVMEHYKYGGNQFEGSVLGDGVLQTFQTPSAVVSGVICWDMDFPHVIRQSGRNGTDVLLVPANDWEAVSTTHAQMAVFRAVENGVSIVRHAKNGLSIAVDPYGRTLARMDHFTATERLMISQVPTTGVPTVYSFVGDLFAWGTVVGFPILAILAIRDSRK